MSKLKISIVIPCSNDLRLKKCLSSIDVNCDVVVALNCPTAKIISIVREFNVRSVTINKRNLPAALNAGIKKAFYNRVILIDSDCTFKKGAIGLAYLELKSHEVVKGYVFFRKDDFQSTIVSNHRNFVNYFPPKPYNPFLCFDKHIKDKIGGYYFDESIPWTEDAELYIRLKKAAINFYFAKNTIAYHDYLSFGQDLKSAFNYGTGKATRVAHGIASGSGTHFKNFFKISSKFGIFTGIYLLFWNLLYFSGYSYHLLIEKTPHG